MSLKLPQQPSIATKVHFGGCMSIRSHFYDVIAKMGMTIGKYCLWVEIIAVPTHVWWY